MTYPMFNSCCFCIPLEIGTLVLGYFYAFCNLLGLLLSTMAIITGFGIALGDIDTEDLAGQDTGATGLMFVIVGSIFLTLFVVKMVFTVLLLIGGHKGNPTHIKAFLNFSIVMLIITVILNFMSYLNAPLSLVATHVLAYALEVYFLLVIHSYMVKLREAENEADELPIKVPIKI